jgi:hypothetical protein
MAVPLPPVTARTSLARAVRNVPVPASVGGVRSRSGERRGESLEDTMELKRRAAGEAVLPRRPAATSPPAW